MTKHGKTLLDAALGLAEDERAEMVARLLDSLAPAPVDVEVERAWALELEGRARRVRDHGPSGNEGDAVFARIRRDVLDS